MLRTWRLDTTFDSLRNPHFRWLWLGRLASSATFQMGTVAQGWLVYQLTGSAFALSWVSAGGSLATFLLSLWGGVLCDRLKKRDILLWTRGAMGIINLVIGVLITTGAIRIWHLVVTSILSGTLFCFIMPAEQSIVSELVDKRTLLNAFSLNAIGMGIMGIFSSSAAGLIIKGMGVDGVYYLMAFFYLAAVFTISHLPNTPCANNQDNSVLTDFREGLRYLLHSPIILSMLGLALSRVFFAMSYRTFMPKFANDVMHFDASGLGVLMSAPGIGALVSSLTLASLGDFRGKGKLLLYAGIATGAFLVLFVSSGFFPLVFVALILMGAADNVCMVTNSTLIQSYSDSAFRGRVVSVYLMTWGMTPLGSIPAGAAADRWGVPIVVGLQGVLLAGSFFAMLFKRKVKQLE